jgi:hypothetical protein
MNFAGCLTALETATSGLACVVLKKWRGRENDLGRALPSAPAKVQGLLFSLRLVCCLGLYWACLGLSRHFCFEGVLGLSWCCFEAVLGLSWAILRHYPGPPRH